MIILGGGLVKHHIANANLMVGKIMLFLQLYYWTGASYNTMHHLSSVSFREMELTMQCL